MSGCPAGYSDIDDSFSDYSDDYQYVSTTLPNKKDQKVRKHGFVYFLETHTFNSRYAYILAECQ